MNKEKLQQDIDAVNARDGEPFGYFKAEPFGWTDCGETDEGAVALYERPQPNQSADFDEWFKNPYTKVLQDSIKNDYVPKADQSEYIKRLEDALTASLALNINWSSEAETEMLSYFSEYKDVITQAKEALASKESIDG